MNKITQLIILNAFLYTLSFAGGGGDILRSNVLVDSLEYQLNDEKTLYWDTSAYVGYDANKIYLYSEGETTKDGESGSENQVLLSHAIAPFWDLQVGIDYDTLSTNNKTWGVIALSGLAPYYFETRASLLLGSDGNIGLRFDAEYEALITQKLILTPKFTLDAYTKDAQDLGIGNGLSNLTLGARLRYEFRREFAPYMGIEWSKNFGKTQDNNALNETYVVMGIRFWF